MKKIIELNYDSATQELNIQCQYQEMNTSAIQGTPVAEWVQPGMKNGLRWCGLYEELKFFCGMDHNPEGGFYGSQR